MSPGHGTEGSKSHTGTQRVQEKNPKPPKNVTEITHIHKKQEVRVLLCWFLSPPVVATGNSATLVPVLAGFREPLDIQGNITVASARAKW